VFNADWSHADWSHADWFNRAGLIRTGLIRTGLIRTGLIRTGLIRTGSIRTGSMRTGACNTMVVIGGFHLLVLCASIANEGSTYFQRFLPSELTLELLLFFLERSSPSSWHVSTIVVILIGGFPLLVLCVSIANEGDACRTRGGLRGSSSPFDSLFLIARHAEHPSIH
jgi:hypothetical protein